MGSGRTDAGDLLREVHVANGLLFCAGQRRRNDALDSDADPGTGRTGNYTLVNGEFNESVDVGGYQPASIGDYVWLDTNGNGIQDGGEMGKAGVSVELFRVR